MVGTLNAPRAHGQYSGHQLTLLADARVRAGLTQAALGELLGVGASAIGCYERGVDQISDALRCRWLAVCADRLEAAGLDVPDSWRTPPPIYPTPDEARFLLERYGGREGAVRWALARLDHVRVVRTDAQNLAAVKALLRAVEVLDREAE